MHQKQYQIHTDTVASLLLILIFEVAPPGESLTT